MVYFELQIKNEFNHQMKMFFLKELINTVIMDIHKINPIKMLHILHMDPRVRIHSQGHLKATGMECPQIQMQVPILLALLKLVSYSYFLKLKFLENLIFF